MHLRTLEMRDENKSKKGLINELMHLRRRIAELEQAESERDRAERALLNSQERLNLALKSSEAGTWDRDIAADKATWDEHLHALFGLVPGAFSGKLEDFLAMLHPDDRERVKNELSAAIDGDADYATTYRVVWPDSSVHVVADRGKTYRDDEGRPARMIGVSLDVTELKQTEEALRESQQQLADIINFLPDATFVIDREGKVISWNRAIERMTGVKAEDMLGKGNYEYALLFHGARRPILIDLVLHPKEEVEASYENIERKESALAGEVYMPALKGGAVCLFGTASILHDSKGNIVGAIESVRDITDRKRSDEELASYRAHLEDLVKERTATLAEVNEQLRCEIEERTKAEQALRESQQMLQSVLDTIPVRVFWKNLESKYLGCNRPFALDAGLQSPDEIIGRNDFEVGWVEQAELYRSDDRLVMETGRPKLGYEEPQTTPDGNRIWLRTNKVPLLDAEGRMKGVLGTYEDITENKRIQEALLRAHERLKMAQHGAGAGTWDWDITTGQMEWSDRLFEIFGLDSKKATASLELWESLLHPEDREAAAARSIRAITEQNNLASEYRIVLPDGQLRWINTLGCCAYDEYGSPVRMDGICMDITERKRMEDVIRNARDELEVLVQERTEDLLRANDLLREQASLLDLAHDAILVRDPHGRVLYWNQGAEKTYGWTRDEARGQVAHELLQTQFPEPQEGIWTQLMEAGEWEGELNHIKRNGSPMIMESRQALQRNLDGEPSGILEINRDITKRKEAEANIVRAKVLLQAVFDGISDPLLLIDKYATVAMLNEAARKYFKVTGSEEAVGRRCYDLAFGKGSPCDRCGVIPAMIEGKKSTFEREEGLFDPERIEQVTVYPLEEAVSGIPGAIVRIGDITESRNIEKHLMQVDRLSSLGLVAGGIAHEIRNPLQGVSLFIDVLSDEEKFHRTTQELDILEEMKISIKKIDGIIRRVLHFSKQSVTISQKLEVGTLIEEGLRLWRTKLMESGIRIRFSVAENHPEVLGDPVEIQQVLTNLVQNALEAMENDGVLDIIVENGTLSFDKIRPAVIVKVGDSGPGIRLDLQKNVFKPFFTTKHTGTGLGLAISHRIISRHGGLLSFSSSPGVGTTFTIELPALQEA
jgi:PAS domain S-box-containing protein